MPTKPSASTEDTRSLLGRNVLLTLMVAPLFGVVWWFSSDTNAPPPMGRAEESLRAQANELLQLQGHAAAHQPCEYWTKRLFLLCSVSLADLPRLSAALVQSGWKETSEHAPQRNELAYRRADYSAKVTCTDRNNECSLYLYYPR